MSIGVPIVRFVTDVVHMVNEIIAPELDTDSCDYQYMDVDGSGSVDVIDVIAVVQIIIG